MHQSLPQPGPSLDWSALQTPPSQRCLSSKELLGPDRELLIEHNGSYYHLRLTRQNKLILTK